MSLATLLPPCLFDAQMERHRRAYNRWDRERAAAVERVSVALDSLWLDGIDHTTIRLLVEEVRPLTAKRDRAYRDFWAAHDRWYASKRRRDKT